MSVLTVHYYFSMAMFASQGNTVHLLKSIEVVVKNRAVIFAKLRTLLLV